MFFNEANLIGEMFLLLRLRSPENSKKGLFMFHF